MSRSNVADPEGAFITRSDVLITGGDVLMDGGVTASCWYGELAAERN